MDTKKIFGIILTSLGIIGILYGAYVVIRAQSFATLNDWVTPLVVFIVAFIFFAAGIGLIKSAGSTEYHEHRDR